MAIQKVVMDIEMMDGTVHEDLRIILADMVKFEDVARRHKWGSMEDEPIRASSFMAYAAMTRTGLYDANRGYDEFVNDVAMVYQDEATPLDPTQPATPAG